MLPLKRDISYNRWKWDWGPLCSKANADYCWISYWYPVEYYNNSGIIHVLQSQKPQFKVLILHLQSKIWRYLKISIPSNCVSPVFEITQDVITQEGKCFFTYSMAFNLFISLSHRNFMVRALSLKFFRCPFFHFSDRGKHEIFRYLDGQILGSRRT